MSLRRVDLGHISSNLARVDESHRQHFLYNNLLVHVCKGFTILAVTLLTATILFYFQRNDGERGFIECHS